MGRATIEAVLQMSAEQVAGPKEQGRRDADRELYTANSNMPVRRSSTRSSPALPPEGESGSSSSRRRPAQTHER